jgi:hypothetical protein
VWEKFPKFAKIDKNQKKLRTKINFKRFEYTWLCAGNIEYEIINRSVLDTRRLVAYATKMSDYRSCLPREIGSEFHRVGRYREGVVNYAGRYLTQHNN